MLRLTIFARTFILFGLLIPTLGLGQAPSWEWVNSASSSGTDKVTSIAADSSTNTVVVAGYLDAIPAQYPGIGSLYGGIDGFVAKYDLSGNVLWSFNIGGVGDDYINSMAVDPSGHIYIAGHFGSPTCNMNGVSGGNPSLGRNPSGDDLFVAKYDANGVAQWSVSNGGGNGNDKALAISANASGAYVTGYYEGAFSFGAWSSSRNSGLEDWFLAHFSPTGAFVWAVEGGDDDNTAGMAIHATPNGVFAAGRMTGTTNMHFNDTNGNLQGAFGFSNTNPFMQSIFLMALSPAGAFQWTGLIGGTQDCRAGGILEYEGAVYLTGGIDKDAEFPGTATLFGPTPHQNLFLSRHDLVTGNTEWVAAADGKKDSYGRALSVTYNGTLVASGFFEDSLDFSTFGGPFLDSTNDVVITAFDTSGAHQWTKAAGEAGWDEAYAISAMPHYDAIFVAGDFDANTSFDSISMPHLAGTDIWIGKMTECNAEFDYGSGPFCQLDSVLPVITGNPGGLFSEASGNIDFINTSTGAVDLVNSTVGGPYSIVYTAPLGCRDTFQMTVLAQPAVDLGTDTAFCAPDSILLDAGNSGSSYLWSTGALTQTIHASATGLYSVSVSNGGCTDADAINITVGTPPTVNLGPDSTLCAPASLLLDAGNSGASFLWSTGDTSQSITVTTTGSYSVTVDDGLCAASDTINVYLNPPPTVDLGPDTAFCAPDSLLLDAGNAGANFSWSTGALSQTIHASATGNYSVTVDVGGCSATDAVNITVGTPPTVNLGPDSTLCAPASLLLDAGNSGASFLWSTGDTSQSITVTTTGSYSVTVDDGLCAASDTINVYLNPPPTVDLGPDTAFCAPDSLLLDAGNAGANFYWSTGAGSQTIHASATGNYSVTVDVGGCSATDAVNITVGTPPTVNLGPDSSTCSNSFTLDAGNAGATYLWSTGASSQSITVTTTGSYSVTVDDGLCAASDDINIILDSAPDVDLGSDTTLCVPDSLRLDAGSMGQSYLWSTGATSQHITVSNSGTYGVTVSIGNCLAAGSLNVTFEAPPLVDAGEDQTLSFGDAGELHGQSSPNSLLMWQLISGSGSISNPISAASSVLDLGVGPNNFLLTATSATGCSATDGITLTFLPFEPNRAFSPNGDNINDFFVIPGLAEFPGTGITVFNRWGQEIYSQSDYQNDWEGSNSTGESLPSDTYFYILKFQNGSRIKGHVALQR